MMNHDKISKRETAATCIILILFIITVLNQNLISIKSAPEPFPGFSNLEELVIILGIIAAIAINQRRKK